MMNIITDNRIKDYEILEQNQKPGNSQEKKLPEEELSFAEIIGFIIGFFVFILFSIFIYKQYEKRNFIDNQESDYQKTFASNNLSQSYQNETEEELNETSIPEVKFYEMENKEELNLTKYKNYFPIINGDENFNITDLSYIFEAKKLFIKDVNITKDYIQFLRKNDDEYDQRNNEHIFYEPYDPKYIMPHEDQLSVEEFYKLCDKKDVEYVNSSLFSEFPFLSIIIPIYNKNLDLVKSLRSIQYQTFKNLEIIIVDDITTNHSELYGSLFQKEPRLRLFTQSKNMGIWKKRLDGYLYSRGKFIMHMNPGDILSDNYILDDICNLTVKYILSSIRFAFSKTNYDKKFLEKHTFAKQNIYDRKYIQLLFGSSDYDISEYGFGNIWNIMVRSNVYTMGFESSDEYTINTRNDYWESIMWNDMINIISLSNLVINRLGYINLYNSSIENVPNIKTAFKKEKTIKELIHYWLLDYQLLKKQEKNYDEVIEALKNFTNVNNVYSQLKINHNDLSPKYGVYEHLLSLLMEDELISEELRIFFKTLYNDYKNKTERQKIKINKKK